MRPSCQGHLMPYFPINAKSKIKIIASVQSFRRQHHILDSSFVHDLVLCQIMIVPSGLFPALEHCGQIELRVLTV